MRMSLSTENNNTLLLYDFMEIPIQKGTQMETYSHNTNIHQWYITLSDRCLFPKFAFLNINVVINLFSTTV